MMIPIGFLREFQRKFDFDRLHRDPEIQKVVFG